MWRRKKARLKFKPLKKGYKKIEKVEPPPKVEVKKPEPEIKFKGHFMKRNVNFSLFFLIIVILGSLIGLTSYYQNTYMDQSRKLQEKSQEFDVAIDELKAKRTMLNETTYQLEVESESKEKLGGLYTEVREEKERVESTLQDTKQQLDSTLVTLESTRSELSSTKAELTSVRDKLENVEDDLEQCKDEKDSYKSQRDSCQTDFSTCCGGDTTVCS